MLPFVLNKDAYNVDGKPAESKARWSDGG